MIKANNPNLTSWVNVPEQSDFPIQNLPFGIYSTESKTQRVGVAIGNEILDISSLFELNYLNELPFKKEDFSSNFLNEMMSYGKKRDKKFKS
jgi:fumarylacetoacetase